MSIRETNKRITTFTDGDHEVSLYQCINGEFFVAYGEQNSRRLDYANAAKEFGECVLHSLGCAGKLDNEEGDEE